MLSAVVLTPGRTGSQIILKNLQQYFGKNNVIHTHDPLVGLTTPAKLAVISHRRDIFSAIVSTLVGKRTNEFTHYQGKYNKKFTVNQTEFESAYQHHKIFYEVIDKQNFVQCVDMYHEDVIADPDYLFSKLNIERTTNLNLQAKSPYNNRELISNIDQCCEWFDHLTAQVIPLSQIDLYRASIRRDLNIINGVQ
jgi:hypothetical protein